MREFEVKKLRQKLECIKTGKDAVAIATSLLASHLVTNETILKASHQMAIKSFLKHGAPSGWTPDQAITLNQSMNIYFLFLATYFAFSGGLALFIYVAFDSSLPGWLGSSKRTVIAALRQMKSKISKKKEQSDG